MRLTKLKLAGFKSFVDPTTILLPGQLIGVVGPNGCGKSNVMDAVRWVLGESKASELRGESMQDVIFNGSASRKAVSRASVELVFDNSLGRISGQFGQYAELSVKRMLSKSGQSEYYINNLHVRKKDITDLFLGTGLGPRAYAIIGQGTISRIIEARPDELRVFLEEAAGVTKYKERRRETENRIADTRDNLTRVADIREVLAGQIDKLEEQAAVAREYRHFHSEMTRKQQLLWLVKKNDAANEEARLTQAILAANNDLEAENTAAQNAETALTEARETHYLANETLQEMQEKQYAANFEVATQESEMAHRRESLEAHQSRQAQIEDDLVHWQSVVDTAKTEHARFTELQTFAQMRAEEGQMRVESCEARLPELEEAFSHVQEASNALVHKRHQCEQQLKIEETHKNNSERAKQNMGEKRDRMRRELTDLDIPDEMESAAKEEQIALLEAEIDELQNKLASVIDAQSAHNLSRKDAFLKVQSTQNTEASLIAKRSALNQLQKKLMNEGDLGKWLAQNHLENKSALWQNIEVETKWQSAIEAILREKISALSVDEIRHEWEKERPNAKFVLLNNAAQNAPQNDAKKMPAAIFGDHVLNPSTYLKTHVHAKNANIENVLAHWLNGVFTSPDLETALLRRDKLNAEQCLVTPSGDIITRECITFFAPDATHGLLERQQEIEALSIEIALIGEEVAHARETLQTIEEAITDNENALVSHRSSIEEKKSVKHQISLEALRLAQIIERFNERKAQLDLAIADIKIEEEAENERIFVAEEAINEHKEQLFAITESIEAQLEQQEKADRSVREARTQLSEAQKALQEAQFSLRECVSKLEEAAKNGKLAEQQMARLTDEKSRGAETQKALNAEDLEEKLQLALAKRVDAEKMLAAAREALETITQNVRHLEETKMRHEHALSPLREKINELRLKEQAAALNAAQFAEQLSAAQADELSLAADLQNAKPQALQSTINGLQKAIEELGAVNLAALEELEKAQEKKAFLDTQAADLTLAMETLEAAIMRIDKDTRALLKNTFDAVNTNFGELFPTLFGGGEARLIMTGEEILDAGVQVMAQPPGKKNSSIYLLSGGEKALTAIALVFALFQLNPAPFCLLDEVDAPLDDTNTERFCEMVKRMSKETQFLFISHNKIAMEMAKQLVGVTMQEAGVSRIVEVDMEEALKLREQIV